MDFIVSILAGAAGGVSASLVALRITQKRGGHRPMPRPSVDDATLTAVLHNAQAVSDDPVKQRLAGRKMLSGLITTESAKTRRNDGGVEQW